MGLRTVAWLHDAATGRRFVLEGADVAVIGREPRHAVRLPDDRFVSRRHAQIEVVDGEYWLRDLASANGSFLNRRQVTGACRLAEGDVILVGNTALCFERAGGAA